MKEEPRGATGLLIEPLANLSERAALALDQYVRVHDEFFRFSFRRVLPVPAVFAAIDFETCAAELDTVSRDLVNIQEEAASFRTTNPPEESIEPFLSTLQQYLPALSRSTELLRSICLRLALKAQRTSTYGWGEYRRDLAHYRASVDEYVRIGVHLNRALALSPRGPERRSDLERRTIDIVPAVLGQRNRRSGEERRSGTDRRSGGTS